MLYFYAVSDNDKYTASLQPVPLSQALIRGGAGMTGEPCQSPWSVTGSSGRISHTPPLSCFPSILPVPIIVNQSSGVSTGREESSGREAGRHAAGRRAGKQQGSGVRRSGGQGERRCSTPARHHSAMGPPGASLWGPHWAGCHHSDGTFCSTTHNTHS